ncbi:hypothetical protein [Enorma sp.]|uniref:hypothetical protein n=1 Tax=Enorma sp. TaxID=1920692 RepID=UPI003AB7E2ED
MVSIHVDETLYEEFAEAYEQAKDPYLVTKEGCPSFIVMNVSDLVDLENAEPTQSGVASVRSGMADFEWSDYVDARALSREIREHRDPRWDNL